MKVCSAASEKSPTGDPLIPPDVKRTKHMRYRMTERADLGDVEDAERLLGAELVGPT